MHYFENCFCCLSAFLVCNGVEDWLFFTSKDFSKLVTTLMFNSPQWWHFYWDIYVSRRHFLDNIEILSGYWRSFCPLEKSYKWLSMGMHRWWSVHVYKKCEWCYVFLRIIRHNLVYGQTKIPSEETDISNVNPEWNMKTMVDVSK